MQILCIIVQYVKELRFCNKIKFPKFYIVVQLSCIDKGIGKSEFVAKTQFLSGLCFCRNIFLIWRHFLPGLLA